MTNRLKPPRSPSVALVQRLVTLDGIRADSVRVVSLQYIINSQSALRRDIVRAILLPLRASSLSETAQPVPTSATTLYRKYAYWGQDVERAKRSNRVLRVVIEHREVYQ